jgi:tetratricopeptide (TPR) repeat protein
MLLPLVVKSEENRQRQQPPPMGQQQKTPNTLHTKEFFTRLPTKDLLALLSQAREAKQAENLEAIIEKRWLRSGSDTADLLMARATKALERGDGALSAELADHALRQAPDWAGGWNRRALALHVLEDPLGALQDLQHALAIEPRHYPSLVALGHLLVALDRPKEALAAYRRTKAIHPFLSDIDAILNMLAHKVEGQDL